MAEEEMEKLAPYLEMGEGRKSGRDIARLGEDLIVEILVKLPVKLLFRVRCVCKYFYHLTKRPSFINMHIKHHSITKDDECVLVFRTLEDHSKTLLSFHSCESLSSITTSPDLEIPHFNQKLFDVCGPRNGLICLADETNIVLCNPAMREFKLLPPSPLPCPEGWELTRDAVGFGFDYETNDYKVVAFVYLNQPGGDGHIKKVEIYDLSTNSWGETDCDCDFCSDMYPEYIEGARYGMLFNGAFHWVAWRCSEIRVLSFDMSTEEFEYTKLSKGMFKMGSQRCLRVLNESLAFLSYPDPMDIPEQVIVDIWVMREYGVAESWTKQFTIGPFTEIRRPLWFWNEKAILMETKEGRIVSRPLDTRDMIDFDIHGYPDTLGVMVYQESLVSLK